MQEKTVQEMRDLGLQIRAARKALGLTQTDLALAANVGLRFIVDLEAGKASIQLGKTLGVIRALGGLVKIQWV